MKIKNTEEIGRRKQRLTGRLDRGNWGKQGRPMLAGGNERLEVSRRVKATAFGGIGLVHRLVQQLGLPGAINEALRLFRRAGPYTESDHVLNLAYNIVCGGRTLDDLELRRQDEAYLDALGAARIPDPTTAGDFLRRFDQREIDTLSEVINEARVRVWKQRDAAFFEQAIIDVDGTIAATNGECKEGMDMSYKGIWGYAPLLVSLANTREILYTRNRPGNRPSHDGCFEYLDPAVEVVRDAGFRRVLLRGDGHFALTENFDHWTTNDVEFVFDLAAHPSLVAIAEGLGKREWTLLQRDVRSKGKGRGGPKRRVKKEKIEERAYEHLELEREHHAEFLHRPGKCSRAYRVIVLRKTIQVRKGQKTLFPEIRYHFYITNATPESICAREVIRHANKRCDQENVIEQAKNGFHAMRMPTDTLEANDAYMLIACLAWNLKSWLAQLWPDKEQGASLLRMEFRRFVASVIAIPSQVVATGRQIVHRFLGYTAWLAGMLTAHQRLRCTRFA